ncbi:MAG TPA: hypothetical protein VMF69_16695 [Gemmataceae bacterium]|nr:hypothetical protein [Gemmataceae bacterium]
MSAKLVALKLFLDELEIESNIDTIDDRKRVQKAVYLGQIARVDLGYRFGWYLRGPYSPGLTKDYYALADAVNSGELDTQGRTLKPELRERLRRIRPLLDPPPEGVLSQEDWLELLASLHFLRRVSMFDSNKSTARIRQEKPYLQEFLPQAESQLQRHGLLGNANDPSPP